MTHPETTARTADAGRAGGRRGPLMLLAWLWVGLPFGYGLYELGLKLRQLFTG